MTIGVQFSDYDHLLLIQTKSLLLVFLMVNDDISVSYNMHELETELSTDEDQESTGISASFTSGGMTLAGSMNDVDNIAGTQLETQKVMSLHYHLHSN